MITLVLAAFFCLSSPEEGALRASLGETFARCADHYRVLDAKATPDLAKGLVPRGRKAKTDELDMRNIYAWTSGHFPGALWYLHEATGDDFFRDRATAWTEVIAPIAQYEGTHDVGFMVYCSFGNARRVLKTDRYDALIVQAADSLSKRFNPELGLLRSWGKVTDKKDFLVIPDNMMNLELLEWASKAKGGDARFDRIARSHASVTMRHHFRADGGTYHVLNYDQRPGFLGAVQEIRRGQGLGCESAWSRGQAWAMYGYTMMYRETKDPAYLEFARKVSDYAIDHPNMPSDGVPYWDFGAPGEERDTSAAAIMASALLELSTFVPGEDGRRYRAFAVRQLRSLSAPAYFAAPGENGDWILKHGVGHKPDGTEVDTPLNYGDYYYLEALLRFKRLFDEPLLASKPAECPEEWYLDFTRNGNRTRYQGPHGQRIDVLEKLLASEFSDRKGAFVPKIAEYLEALLSERSWTLPAHDAELTSWNGTPHVDLGAGRRGEDVASALAICGERLPKDLRDRAARELERRIFQPYLRSAAGEKIAGHWWFHTQNNWNAVCHTCVVRAAIDFYPAGNETRNRIVAAAVEAVPFFLSGFTDDGYCSEGAGYWNYGYGHFLMMAESLKESEGVDLFAKFPKTKAIAAYGFEYKMTPRTSPRFADGGGSPSATYLAKCSTAWPDLKLQLGPRSEFADAQVWICRPNDGKPGLTLGFKGGHNNEFHNHNDLGSYDIALGDTILAGDVGGEVYTRRTFSAQRYESKVLSSYAHPVPRLDGALQGTGRKFAAKFVAKSFGDAVDTVTLDLAGAYDCPKLVSFRRTFTYDRAGKSVTITDAVKFNAPAAFEDPLVTLGAYEDGAIVVDGVRLGCAVTAKGGDFTWWTESVENPGHLPPQIKGVRFDSVTEAEVTFRFTAE